MRNIIPWQKNKNMDRILGKLCSIVVYKRHRKGLFTCTEIHRVFMKEVCNFIDGENLRRTRDNKTPLLVV